MKLHYYAIHGTVLLCAVQCTVLTQSCRPTVIFESSSATNCVIIARKVKPDPVSPQQNRLCRVTISNDHSGPLSTTNFLTSAYLIPFPPTFYTPKKSRSSAEWGRRSPCLEIAGHTYHIVEKPPRCFYDRPGAACFRVIALL